MGKCKSLPIVDTQARNKAVSLYNSREVYPWYPVRYMFGRKRIFIIGTFKKTHVTLAGPETASISTFNKASICAVVLRSTSHENWFSAFLASLFFSVCSAVFTMFTYYLYPIFVFVHIVCPPFLPWPTLCNFRFKVQSYIKSRSIWFIFF